MWFANGVLVGFPFTKHNGTLEVKHKLHRKFWNSINPFATPQEISKLTFKEPSVLYPEQKIIH